MLFSMKTRDAPPFVAIQMKYLLEYEVIIMETDEIIPKHMP